jgi:hypothetical protein
MPTAYQLLLNLTSYDVSERLFHRAAEHFHYRGHAKEHVPGPGHEGALLKVSLSSCQLHHQDSVGNAYSLTQCRAGQCIISLSGGENGFTPFRMSVG